MTHSPVEEVPSDPPANDVPKLRQCLRCRVKFHSAWAGERICSRCKRVHGGTAGRLGPLAAAATGNLRSGPWSVPASNYGVASNSQKSFLKTINITSDFMRLAQKFI